MTPPNPTDASKRAREIAEEILKPHVSYDSRLPSGHFVIQTSHSAIHNDVQSAITPLLERIDELEGALKPVMEAHYRVVKYIPDPFFDGHAVQGTMADIAGLKYGDLRHAAKVLEKGKGK